MSFCICGKSERTRNEYECISCFEYQSVGNNDVSTSETGKNSDCLRDDKIICLSSEYLVLTAAGMY